MNREILFRGKLLEDSKAFKPYKKGMFIEGGYCREGDEHFIVAHHNVFKVDPSTIGQLHNALTRKVGSNVFVGDIIKHDLEAGLGQPNRIGLTETVRSVEFDFHYYSNVRLIGNIHEEREVKNG